MIVKCIVVIIMVTEVMEEPIMAVLVQIPEEITSAAEQSLLHQQVAILPPT